MLAGVLAPPHGFQGDDYFQRDDPAERVDGHDRQPVGARGEEVCALEPPRREREHDEPRRAAGQAGVQGDGRRPHGSGGDGAGEGARRQAEAVLGRAQRADGDL